MDDDLGEMMFKKKRAMDRNAQVEEAGGVKKGERDCVLSGWGKVFCQ